MIKEMQYLSSSGSSHIVPGAIDIVIKVNELVRMSNIQEKLINDILRGIS